MGLVSCGEAWNDGEWRAVSYTGYDGTIKVTVEKERDVGLIGRVGLLGLIGAIW
jgi:hypothetical protein